MSLQSETYVELDRTFREVPASGSESDDFDLLRSVHYGNSLGWPGVLEEYRTVLLAEAGTGKTFEIRAQTLRLREERKEAFFLRLEHIPVSLEEAFEIGTAEEFQSWLDGLEQAWLFLDSVDEARLRSPGDFEAAIRRIAVKIRPALQRVHIVLTGRASAWRPRTDLDLIKRLLAFQPVTQRQGEATADGSGEKITTKPVSESPDPFKVVTLEDLRGQQITRFAVANGVEDTDAFIKAIERTDAWSFAARPQDLQDLIGFWIDKGRIGSRWEIVANSIARRLSERDANRDEATAVPPSRIRQGALLAAAANTLTHTQAIQIPDGAHGTDGLAIAEVLSDWTAKEIGALLSRPIFDVALYGAVRFHHRSVREFLTAEWFGGLLAKETSRRKIEELFFQNQYGMDIVTPTLRPILPWLAAIDVKICDRLVRIAPEVLLEGGDPNRLPLETRRTILSDMCDQIASGTSRQGTTDYAAVERFAHQDLAGDVKDLVTKYRQDSSVLWFLMRLAWLGELQELLPAAKEIAVDADGEHYARIGAIRVVRSVGGTADQAEIRSAIQSEDRELERDLLAELFESLQPDSELVGWVLSAIGKAKERPRYSSDSLADEITKFVEGLSETALLPLIQGFNQYLNMPPVVERRHCEVSTKFSWLLGPALRGVERLLEMRSNDAFDPAIMSVLHKFPSVKHYDVDGVPETAKRTNALVADWVEFNRSLFWSEVELERQWCDERRGERLISHHSIGVGGHFWCFLESDFDYLLNQIRSQPNLDNKLVAMSVAFDLYRTSGRKRGWREKLKRACAVDREVATTIGNYLRPPRRGRSAFSGWEARHRKQMAERERKKAQNAEEWRIFLQNNLDKVRGDVPEKGELQNSQWYLLERLREDEGNFTRYVFNDWSKLAPSFGEDVAEAFRIGLKAFWRNHVPSLFCEGAALNSTPYAVIFGLNGLSLESREALNWPETLTDDEAVIATRYAFRELNGFPAWLPELFKAHRRPLADLMVREIIFELSNAGTDTSSHYLLHDVSWSGDWSWDDVAPGLLDYLRDNEPASPGNLDYVLKIVDGSSISSETISAVCRKKCAEVTSHSHLSQWFATWVGVDADAAVAAFSDRLKNFASDDRVSFAMAFITSLLGDRRGRSQARDGYKSVAHLKKLYLLMHVYIRAEDDIERAGKGVYSPELRDDAQDARDRLAELLRNIPGKESFFALMEIAADHPSERHRPWYYRHAKIKAESDADLPPWSTSQVRDFSLTLERTPRSHRELGELLALRIADLKDDLEKGDMSMVGFAVAETGFAPSHRRCCGLRALDVEVERLMHDKWFWRSREVVYKVDSTFNHLKREVVQRKVF